MYTLTYMADFDQNHRSRTPRKSLKNPGGSLGQSFGHLSAKWCVIKPMLPHGGSRKSAQMRRSAHQFVFETGQVFGSPFERVWINDAFGSD